MQAVESVDLLAEAKMLRKRNRAAAMPSTSREAILTATRVLLRTHSFASMTVEDVSRQAGVTRRTFYNQFVSKDQLYRCSRMALIETLAMRANDEIPRRMSIADGLMFLCNQIHEICLDPAHLEIATSILRDREDQPWVAETYDRLVRRSLITSGEAFLFSKAHRQSITTNYPRMVAEQLFAIVQAIVMGPTLLGTIPGDEDGSDSVKIAIIAKAFAGLFENRVVR